MWKKKNEVFLKKKCLKVCRLRKKLYLCTRIQGNASQHREICGNSSVGRARPCQGRGRGSESRLPLIFLNNPMFFWKVQAQVAELVDAHVSGACVSRRAGSSPVLGTKD